MEIQMTSFCQVLLYRRTATRVQLNPCFGSESCQSHNSSVYVHCHLENTVSQRPQERSLSNRKERETKANQEPEWCMCFKRKVCTCSEPQTRIKRRVNNRNLWWWWWLNQKKLRKGHGHAKRNHEMSIVLFQASTQFWNDLAQWRLYQLHSGGIESAAEDLWHLPVWISPGLHV